MSYSHEEGGYHQRHMSVSNYTGNIGSGNEGARRRSSIARAADVVTDGASNENVLNQKDEALRKMSLAVPNLAEITSDAKIAAELERKMTFREGLRLYPKAIMFSAIISLAVIMGGYDTALLGNFYGYQQFNRKYGRPAGTKGGVQQFQVPASWQSALSNGGPSRIYHWTFLEWHHL
jgi:hypothetical protein